MCEQNRFLIPASRFRPPSSYGLSTRIRDPDFPGRYNVIHSARQEQVMGALDRIQLHIWRSRFNARSNM